MFLNTNSYLCYLEEIKLKKIVSIALIFLLVASMVGVAVYADNSPGPAPDSGDGVPSGNLFIRPENPGVGPAPYSGDGIPDGSGF